MRLYSFVNMYLCGSIHAGIQTAHGVHELYEKYLFVSGESFGKISDWALNHKTIIALNGGYQSSIEETLQLLNDVYSILNLPFASFHEEKNSLNGALTVAVVVLPEEIYNYPVERTVDVIHSEWLRNSYENYIKPKINDDIYHKEMAKLRVFNHIKSKRLA